jgi:hypothetical protein
MILWCSIGGSIIFLAVFGAIFAYFIRKSYVKFDEIETQKEKIIEIRAKIKESLTYFKANYEHHVHNSIKLNVDLCLEIILNKNLADQIMLLESLYEKLYETGYRLKMKYDDPVYILAPLKNFREELAEELIDYLKDVERGL